jgi:hypothetical protein
MTINLREKIQQKIFFSIKNFYLMSKLQEKPSTLVGHFALLDPDTESGTSLNPIHTGYGSGSGSIALVLLTWSPVLFPEGNCPEWLPSAAADV